MQQELCTGLACSHKPSCLECSPCSPEQSWPWLYFCRKQCAIAKVVHEKCCLPFSPRAKPLWVLESSCLPSRSAGPAPCSAQPSSCQLDLCHWLWILLDSGLYFLAKDHAALLWVMLHSSGLCHAAWGPPCRVQDHIACCSIAAGSLAGVAGMEPCMPPSMAA